MELLTELDGLIDAEGEIDADSEDEGLIESDADELGLTLADGEIEDEALLLGDTDEEGESDPSSAAALTMKDTIEPLKKSPPAPVHTSFTVTLVDVEFSLLITHIGGPSNGSPPTIPLSYTSVHPAEREGLALAPAASKNAAASVTSSSVGVAPNV